MYPHGGPESSHERAKSGEVRTSRAWPRRCPERERTRRRSPTRERDGTYRSTPPGCHPSAQRRQRGPDAWTKRSAPHPKGQSALREPGDNLLSRKSTIIGGGCLTTVFGMGTGMARHL